MNKKFLFSINGENRSRFYQWISEFEGNPRIAWYPSAGTDYRDLLYLNPAYSKHNPGIAPDPPPPDLFLHTDYRLGKPLPSSDDAILYQDDRTTVTVLYMEELPHCNVPLDPEVVVFEADRSYGYAAYMEVEVESTLLGTFEARMIYLVVENGAFCAERLLPAKVILSHIIHVRYGGGMGGGGYSTGIWLLNILEDVSCECFITDSHHTRQAGDERLYTLYPSLVGEENEALLCPIRTVGGEQWSNYGDVSWNLIDSSRKYITEYVKRILSDSVIAYDWTMPATFPEGIISERRGTPLERTRRLKAQLCEAYGDGDDNRKIEIINWVIEIWGGISGNDANTIIGYALDDEEVLLARGVRGISSWSKALAIRNPQQYAIYDSRVAVALNALLIIGGIREGAVPKLFPFPTGRNMNINEAKKVINEYKRTKRLSSIPTKLFYNDYLSLIKKVGSTLAVDFEVVEMILFAYSDYIAHDLYTLLDIDKEV